MAEKEKEKRKTKSVALPADAPESPVSPRKSNARKSAHPTLSSYPEDLADPDPGSPKGRTPAAKRRVTSLYSEEERARRGSHGGMSVLAIEAELAKFQMFSGCSPEMISELSQRTTSRICNEGQVMQAKGDHTDALLIVLRGTLNIFLGEECIGQMRKGDHVGETFFLAVEDLWNIQLVAAELGMVCDVSREVLQNVLKDFPADKELLNPYLSQPPHVHLLTSERMLQSPIFAQLSESAWEIFRDNMVRRIFFPGETILSEESDQKYLVLLARGAASIEIAGRTIRVERRGESLRGLSQREGVAMELDANSSEDAVHPAVLGDAEFLGLNDVRVCSVKADAECHCWLIPAPVLAKAFANGENESLLRDLLALRVDRGRVDSGKLSVLSIFDEAGCSFDFLRYLQTHFEGRIFVQGKTICDFEIPMGTRVMHIVTSGYAASVGETEQTRTLPANTVFGMMSALGVAPRPAKVKKVVAVKHCYCQLLHQAVVVRALELFPDQRMKVLTLSNGGQETDTADLIERIQNSPFFANTNPDFVMELANAAVDRIFMPGDLVVNEGEVGNSMFILLNGSADVYVSDKSKDKQEKGQVAKKHDTQIKQMIRVGHLNSGAIAGELAMLGISQTRSASIQASTLCVFWEVTQERAMNILDRFPEERQLFSNVIVQNLDFTVTGRLMNLNLFKGFDRKFRNLLALYCERHAFFPDHAATREGENGDKLWIMNSGPAQLQKRGFKVKLYTPGTHFGSDNMLGISRAYIGSLVAMTVCHMLSLSRASYLHALEQYPSKTAHQRLVKEQKKQAVELKDMLERVAIRKGVWQRYQGELAGGGVSNLSDNELVRRLVKAWYDHVRIVRDKRLHDTMNHQEMLSRIAGWKQKQEDAKKRIEHKTKMKALIKRNLLERGPLQYLEEQKPRDPLLQSTYDAIQDTEPWAEVTWPRSAQQIELLKDWPQPRPSPYYTLRVWEVVRHELRSQDSGSQSRMLPLLGKRPEEPLTPSPEPVPEPSPRKGKGLNRDKFMSGGSAASASPSSTGSDGREAPPPPRPKLDDDARSDASSPSSPRGQMSPWGPTSPTGGGSAPLSRFQMTGRKAMMMAKMIKMRTVGELSTGEVSRADNGVPG